MGTKEEIFVGYFNHENHSGAEESLNSIKEILEDDEESFIDLQRKKELDDYGPVYLVKGENEQGIVNLYFVEKGYRGEVSVGAKKVKPNIGVIAHQIGEGNLIKQVESYGPRDGYLFNSGSSENQIVKIKNRNIPGSKSVEDWTKEVGTIADHCSRA